MTEGGPIAVTLRPRPIVRLKMTHAEQICEALIVSAPWFASVRSTGWTVPEEVCP
jgi:hypothetical protein